MAIQSAKPRIKAIDIAKGISILAIIIGHIGFPINGDLDLLRNVVFQFHVPVFFIVGGYFLKDKPLLPFIKDKFVRLYKPYVLTCFVLVAVLAVQVYLFRMTLLEQFGTKWRLLLACLYGTGWPATYGNFEFPYVGAIWFLQALFIALVLVQLAIKLENKFNLCASCCFVLFVFILGWRSVEYVWLPCNVQSGMVGALYLYIGLWLGRKKFLERKVDPLLFLACFIVLLVAAKYGDTPYLVMANFYRSFLSFPISIFSSLFILMLSQLIEEYLNRFMSPFLVFLGENSLVMLCAHLVMIDCSFWSFVIGVLHVPDLYNLPYLVNFVLQVAIASGFVVLARRVPFLKWVFYTGSARSKPRTAEGKN